MKQIDQARFDKLPLGIHLAALSHCSCSLCFRGGISEKQNENLQCGKQSEFTSQGVAEGTGGATVSSHRWSLSARPVRLRATLPPSSRKPINTNTFHPSPFELGVLWAWDSMTHTGWSWPVRMPPKSVAALCTRSLTIHLSSCPFPNCNFPSYLHFTVALAYSPFSFSFCLSEKTSETVVVLFLLLVERA